MVVGFHRGPQAVVLNWTRKVVSLVIPLLTQGRLGGWIEAVSGPSNIPWERRKVSVIWRSGDGPAFSELGCDCEPEPRGLR